MENTPYSRFVLLVLFDRFTEDLKKKKIKAEQLFKELLAEQAAVCSQLENERVLLKNERKQRDEVELELAALAQDFAKKELRLEKTSDAKEYGALRNECEALIVRRTAYEERLFELWKTLEELELKVASMELGYADRLKKIEDALELVKQDVQGLGAQIDEREHARDPKQVQGLETELAMYESMRGRVANPAVSLVLNVCSGCGSVVSRIDQAAVEHHVLKPCQQCHRLLFDPKAVQEEKEIL
ncbi:TPA: hypothetical protein DDZ86_02950 [Candidatus Dependentiae bacterium]|nr:MAG: hypothetical protein UW09_C0001G0057 [candidate division TM6 bacterium GW2011_GWF2_43_87]HBL98577.1 hypothetical protein [Candidatus Dependentiae bacterium]